MAGALLHRLKSLFGPKSARALAPYRARVEAINALAPALRGLSGDDLRQRFSALRARREKGEKPGALLNEVFAVTREASARVLGMRHFDVQLLGGMALFDGNIAEMKTGEGKTLVATLPVCLQALSGEGVHVVTVNDYLARRDAEWMGRLYRFLGLSVGVNLPGMELAQKAAAYQCDVTYGTNNEFGFDYLRHNMRYTPEGVQRRLHYAIVDEVDSILIDEARTPLIISGESDESVDLYRAVAQIAAKFRRCAQAEAPGDFTVDEKARAVHLSEEGFDRAEKLFAEAGLMAAGASLYDAAHLPLLHHLDVALRARHLFLRDRDYVVQNGQVVIVDEFTGRLMVGRRWGDSQHQAVEAKEGVQVQKESRTLASISFQNYFRLYQKLAGMTGTAMTEAPEFEFIYGLQTIEIPTHRRMVRADELDKVYRTAAGKNRALTDDIRASVSRGQPVLVGTTAIEDSERLSAVLTKEGIAHNVLNAKNHAGEAGVVAQAGVSGAVTIATNMAGRGTDIVLGGNPEALAEGEGKGVEGEGEGKSEAAAAAREEWQKAHDKVVAAGGLRIIGTERHESRRIDNQLRGRAGRQGDPGSSIFYLSFEDSLLRVFATRHVSALMEKLKMEEDEAIEAKMVSRTIENAQRKVEAHNFDIRRQLLEYDDIANEQRRLIYEQREDILQAEDVGEVARDFRLQQLEALFDEHFPPEAPEEEWRAAEMERLLAADYRLRVPLAEWLEAEESLPRADFLRRAQAAAEESYAAKFADADKERLDLFTRSLILNILDDHWRGHLANLDNLRQSIGFRGMAQKNPKQEYKREAFDMFATLLQTIRQTTARVLYALEVKRAAEAPPPAMPTNLQYRHAASPPAGAAGASSEGAPAEGAPAFAGEGAPSAMAPGVAPQAAPGFPGAAPPPAMAPSAGGERMGEALGERAAGTIRRVGPKVRRNDPCPCGSGKKYKHCCGKI